MQILCLEFYYFAAESATKSSRSVVEVSQYQFSEGNPSMIGQVNRPGMWNLFPIKDHFNSSFMGHMNYWPIYSLNLYAMAAASFWYTSNVK